MKETLLEVTENKDVIFYKFLGLPEFYLLTPREERLSKELLSKKSARSYYFPFQNHQLGCQLWSKSPVIKMA